MHLDFKAYYFNTITSLYYFIFMFRFIIKVFNNSLVGVIVNSIYNKYFMCLLRELYYLSLYVEYYFEEFYMDFWYLCIETGMIIKAYTIRKHFYITYYKPVRHVTFIVLIQLYCCIIGSFLPDINTSLMRINKSLNSLIC